MEEKHGICFALLAAGRIVCIVDCAVVLCSKDKLGHKAVHYVMQVIGSAAGIALLLPIVYAVFIVIYFEKTLNVGLILAVTVEEISYFVCNIMSYEIISEAPESHYTLVPQKGYPCYYPQSFAFLPPYPAPGRHYGEFPIQMNTMPNMAYSGQFNEGIANV
eukprot:TRINITY_DN0_c467_g1_i14.p2 TRINITY_DN0_c467_g1~~TRINITY_DN0_c467_g1_i14.p2  ORF type:complete len:161 (+),score=42.28 TRINITY_DN0_c467_g1_i14:19-501(+)